MSEYDAQNVTEQMEDFFCSNKALYFCSDNGPAKYFENSKEFSQQRKNTVLSKFIIKEFRTKKS
jgi:hypothetical protein